MRKTWLIFSQAVTVAVAALFVVTTLKPEWFKRTPNSIVPTISITEAPATSNEVTAAPDSYAAAAKRAAPAVVNIATSRHTRNTQNADPWLRFFFGNRSNQQNDPKNQSELVQPLGLGSGVIVSPDGYLITNNHVIDGADDIEVMLTDGRKSSAKVVGADPDTDVAVLKINLDKLPSITFADSDNMQVGDVVLAIGNPFGVGQTVTSGIISALGRNQLGINTFENFIQTDAAINPGNSGGALVDAKGNLLGINTAIYSRSGGSMGIGFAIPVSTARQVMEGLIKNGQVIRGWIGVEPQDLTPEMADTFKLPIKEGVLITGVLQGGPAQLAGMRPGDVVTAIGSKVTTNTVQLLNAVAAISPDTKTTIDVQRGKEALTLDVKVVQRPKISRRQPTPEEQPGN